MRLDRLIFCEQVRQEKNGLLFLIGVFPTDHVVVPRDKPAAATLTIPLSCFEVFDHMQGVKVFEQQVEVSRGAEVLHRFPTAKAERLDPRDRLHSHVMALGAVPLPGIGDYHFNFLIKAHGDTMRFSRLFRVIASPPKPEA